MRADETVARDTFRFSPGWKQDAVTGREKPDIDRRLAGGRLEGGKFIAHSLSGGERNHCFLNRHGGEFTDISALSGLDSASDGRGFVLLDYDRDGWQDIAVVNANIPLLNLYHNDIAKLSPPQPHQRPPMIALRFVGGSRSSEASEFACRDGYGAMVLATLGNTVLKREHRCGEGFATQNSSTMIIGIGGHPVVDAVQIRWPSGKSSTLQSVAAGALLTVYENPQDSPNGKPFLLQSYHSAPSPHPPTKTSPPAPKFPLTDLTGNSPAGPNPTRLRVYTTMATWCAACIEHTPELELMRTALNPDGVEFIGVPVDENDDPKKLQSFVDQYRPAYRLLKDLPADRRRSVTAFLKQMTGSANPAIPSTILTDASGKVLLIGAGVPSVSDIRKVLLEQLSP